MRRILLAASLLALMAPAVSATALDASSDVDAGESWFRMWCWDHEIIASTPGFWVGFCVEYVSGCVPACKPRLPRDDAASADATCLNGANYAEKVRNCLYSTLVDEGYNTRMLCAGRYMEAGNSVALAWKCIDYVVFEQVVCTEVRC